VSENRKRLRPVAGTEALELPWYHPTLFADDSEPSLIRYVDKTSPTTGWFTGAAPRRVRRLNPPVRTTHRLSQRIYLCYYSSSLPFCKCCIIIKRA